MRTTGKTFSFVHQAQIFMVGYSCRGFYRRKAAEVAVEVISVVTFMMNIVFPTDPDSTKEVVELRRLAPCTRCKIPTVDLQTGKYRAEYEPLKVRHNRKKKRQGKEKRRKTKKRKKKKRRKGQRRRR